jgi:putative FmdB family regulatory protein
MPIYEYECSSCKFYSELLQKISDPPLKKCPSCGKSTMKKLISAPVFRLKGGGWYETDFKSDGENKRNLADREETDVKAETKTEAVKETKAESKPDQKAPSKASSRTAAKPKAKLVRKPSKPAKAPKRHK